MIFQHFFNSSCPSHQLSVLRILVVAVITFTFTFTFALFLLLLDAVENIDVENLLVSLAIAKIQHQYIDYPFLSSFRQFLEVVCDYSSKGKNSTLGCAATQVMSF